MPKLEKLRAFGKDFNMAMGLVSAPVGIAAGIKYLNEKYQKCSIFCKNPDKTVPISYRVLYSRLCGLKCKMDYHKAEMDAHSKLETKTAESTLKYVQSKQKYLQTKKKLEKSISTIRNKIKFANQTFRSKHAKNLEDIIRKIQSLKTY